MIYQVDKWNASFVHLHSSPFIRSNPNHGRKKSPLKNMTGMLSPN